MSSNAPRVDRANSLSKAVDLGGLYCFLSWGTWEKGRVLQNSHFMRMKSGFHDALRAGYFAAIFLLVGNINSN